MKRDFLIIGFLVIIDLIVYTIITSFWKYDIYFVKILVGFIACVVINSSLYLSNFFK